MKPRPTQTILLWLTFFYVFTSKAQKTSQADFWYQQADSLLEEKAFEPAMEKLNLALPIYQKSEAWEKIAKTRNAMGECHNGLRDFESARQQAEQVLELLKQKRIVQSAEEGHALQLIGYYYQSKSQLPKSLEHMERGLAIHQKTLDKNSKDLGWSYLRTAYVSAWLGKFDNALVLLDSVKRICDRNPKENLKNLARYYGDIRKIHSISGEPDKVIEDLKNEKATLLKFEKRDKVMEAMNEIGFSSYHSKRNENEMALEHIHNAINLYIAEMGEENNWMILMYNNASQYYTRLGENDNALHYAQRSLDISKKIFDPGHIRIGSAYTALALAYYFDFDYEKALEYYLLGNDIYVKNYGEVHWTMVPRYANIGGTYVKLGNDKLAMQNFEKSIAIGKELYGEDYEFLSNTYEQMGNLLASMGNKRKAIENFDRSIQIKLDKYGERNVAVCSGYLNKGICYAEFNEPEKAIFYFDKVLSIYKDIYEDTQKDELVTHDFDNLTLVMQGLLGKAKVKRSQYQQSMKVAYLNDAKEIFNRLDKVDRQMRQRIDKYEDKIDYAKTYKELSKEAIKIYSLLFEVTENFDYLEKVFFFSEQSKSNTLKEMLAKTEKRNLGEYSEFTSLENSIRRNRAKHLSQIEKEKEKGDSKNVEQIEESKKQLFQLNAQYDSLMQALKTEKPSYFEINNTVSKLRLKDIQEKLPLNTTLVDYFIGDSTIYISTISKTAFAVHQSKPGNNFQDMIDAFNAAIAKKNLPVYKDKAHALYQILVKPILSELKDDTLIIVPNDALWNLNFELLLTSVTDSNNPKDLPYLLKDYAISYANSARLVLANDDDSQSNRRNECLAFSFTNSNDGVGKSISLRTLRNEGQDLPGTRQEIRQIAKIMDGQYFYGSNATELNFKKNASGYAILHLALHGKVDDNNPENSKLFFTDSETQTEDNKLYVHELFAMNLPADMAVLSACETGKGIVHTGEGIMSLGNAFQYAGTRSLLLSAWEVSDKVTPELMGLFYRNLEKGMTKSKALQQAKLAYLESSDGIRSNPFYWGSFYMIGDMSPISISSPFNYFYIGISAACCLFLFIIYWKKRSAS
ncbi:CHAT domain-containing protein [Flagellimonas sp.]|uniref:CHAT domain-containing protein n=1 Tax=Flagellimonas sp. TaxID=2058762 RepID=UPI003F4A59A8